MNNNLRQPVNNRGGHWNINNNLRQPVNNGGGYRKKVPVK